MESYEKHGPGTGTNIQCDITNWLAYVRAIGSNPLQVVDGIQMQVRFAYMDQVVRKYDVKGYADLDLQHGRLNFVSHKDWKHVLNEYKYLARNHFFGSAERMFASRREPWSAMLYNFAVLFVWAFPHSLQRCLIV